MGKRKLIDKEELKQMFRDGVNMFNNKSNLSQISSNIDSCTTYEVDTDHYKETTNGTYAPLVILKYVDDLGRIVLPKEVRQALGIDYGDLMAITINGAEIIMSKTRDDKKYIDELTDIIRTWCKKYPDDRDIIRDLESARDKIIEMKE